MNLPNIEDRAQLRNKLKRKGERILYEAFTSDPRAREQLVAFVRALVEDLPTELIQRYLQRRF